MSAVENPSLPQHLLSGRRDFDRQMELLTIAVHTLQRDFGVLAERLAAAREQLAALSAEVGEMADALHSLDKAVVARVATIRVGERVLWMVVAAVIGLGATLLR